ncbi:putative lipoprotein [Leptospira weilii str. 2006001853]|uniref:Putative lipoprotein n=2 Tax=Leptospira weilii TaxID=28184 RepID=A0A828YVQ9_9LEPT|nr:putative lipoprotein [Leptospira weilii str. 2006001853]EMN44502.1 putative lipoprotein [Leptospira weilii str. LNT 1234]EMN92151.1 putative lipoprotein [Leptospira weilii str. UI 13098]QDK25027.1 hypothetical protein FHG67_20220 [Leptospira weilii]QDK28929.1 hypothetical protein FHG68_19965 [Leptospira weilii]
MDCKNRFQMVRKEMRCFGSKKSIQTLLASLGSCFQTRSYSRVLSNVKIRDSKVVRPEVAKIAISDNSKEST